MTNRAETSARPVGSGGPWRLAGLLALLAGLWLLLSGYFTAMQIGFGLVSVLFCGWMARRLDILDDESQPLQVLARALPYWGWLLVEIAKANVDVARRIVVPRLRIEPVLFPTPSGQSSDLGQVIYANSITLTPGTISVDMQAGSILVHALSPHGQAGLEIGEMDRRCTRVVGG